MPRHRIRVEDYDLAATLDSGQAFRWTEGDGAWTAVVGRRRVSLRAEPGGILAETPEPVPDWTWMEDYLQTRVDLKAVLATFPDDPPMRAAVAACRGLRLLRQDPWECLASFILSSAKRIVQIRRAVYLLAERFGEPVAGGAHAFPSAERLAGADLASCGAGFRAPFLRAAAREVADGGLKLDGLDLEEARARLMRIEGVGPKIADCVLLFAYGFPTAFPVDTWVARALREFHFRGRLRRFPAEHFGPNAGYAQQYLFHWRRRR